MASPQILSRGKVALSRRSGRRPARARTAAAVAPPGPAPTMRASYIETWAEGERSAQSYTRSRAQTNQDPLNEIRASDPHRAATTLYRCCLPALTEFEGSWPYGTCP